MKKELFGKLNTGEEVNIFTVSGGKLELSVCEYGAAITSLRFDGKETLLGLDRLNDYVLSGGSVGAVVGRYAGRIAGGAVRINGVRHELTKNDGNNTRAGGRIGFSSRLWHGEADDNCVTLRYVSGDGEEGFPAKLAVTVRYRLVSDSLVIEFFAKSDGDTVVNLSDDLYFNFSGGKRDISGYKLVINANTYYPVDIERLPTGEMRSVDGTPFDFRKGKTLGEALSADDGQLRLISGFDHYFTLSGRGIRKVATLTSELDDVAMECFTDAPCIKLNTANNLSFMKVHGGNEVGRHYGVLLSTQYMPDSARTPYGLRTLKAGDMYTSTTEYRFRNFKQN